MSGSSLDGLDIASCHFYFDGKQWNFQIEKAETISYSAEWRNALFAIREYPSDKLMETHLKYGIFIGNSVTDFIKKYRIEPDLIASHGHTVFHKPDLGYAFQLGSGQAIAITTGIPTVSDFRTKDILLNGQGAPLVPIGDELLFHKYDYCLNLGGIANISYRERGKRRGFDICPTNQLLNYLSRQLGETFDENGRFARLGKLYKPLFDALNDDSYYLLRSPKSLSNETVEKNFLPLFDMFNISIEDKLYTVVKHIAFQINRNLTNNKKNKILVTGGGAHNRFLIKALQLEKGLDFIVPSQEIVDFKEALIFALMGVLRINHLPNCLTSVTGASHDSSSGVVFYP